MPDDKQLPQSVARCETFLLDLMHSIQGTFDTQPGNTQNINTANTSGSKPAVNSDIKRYDPDGVLHRLYGSLQSRNIPVECRVCQSDGVEGSARAYISAPPLRIILCANRLSTKDYAEALTHEATHAFDYVNNTVDFSTCEGLAYSEVRAARNAECATSWPFMKEHCIKSNAAKATSNLFPKTAAECVSSVYEKAMADIRP